MSILHKLHSQNPKKMCDLLSAGPGIVTITGYDYKSIMFEQMADFYIPILVRYQKPRAWHFLWILITQWVSCARSDFCNRNLNLVINNSRSSTDIEYLCTEKRVQVVPKSVSIPSWVEEANTLNTRYTTILPAQIRLTCTVISLSPSPLLLGPSCLPMLVNYNSGPSMSKQRVTRVGCGVIPFGPFRLLTEKSGMLRR